MPSQAELKKRRVKAGKEQIRQEVVIDRRDRRRRLVVGGFVALLAFALIAPLAAGLFGTADADLGQGDVPEIDLVDAADIPEPTLVDPEFEGATLTGATPCPATDGSQERTTSFAEAPGLCIDPAASYTAAVELSAGTIEIELDAAAAPDATNLFHTFASYGVYEGAPITLFEGIAVLGGFGSAGFDVAATEAPADGVYPIGSVVMLTEIGGGMNGQVVVVSNAAGAAALETDATSPIIGQVTSGLNLIDELIELQRENPTTQFRVREATVTESAG